MFRVCHCFIRIL